MQRSIDETHGRLLMLGLSLVLLGCSDAGHSAGGAADAVVDVGLDAGAGAGGAGGTGSFGGTGGFRGTGPCDMPGAGGQCGGLAGMGGAGISGASCCPMYSLAMTCYPPCALQFTRVDFVACGSYAFLFAAGPMGDFHCSYAADGTRIASSYCSPNAACAGDAFDPNDGACACADGGTPIMSCRGGAGVEDAGTAADGPASCPSGGASGTGGG